MIARAFWTLSIFKTSQFQKSTFIFVATPRFIQRPHAFQVASLPTELPWFNMYMLKFGLFVCKFVSEFQSLMDVQPLWHVDAYQQNVFRMSWN